MASKKPKIRSYEVMRLRHAKPRNLLTSQPQYYHYDAGTSIWVKTIMLALSILLFGYADVGSSMRAGNGLCRQGKYEEALKKYQEALVQEPDNIKIHYNMGRALYKAGKYPEAISEFELGLLAKDKKFQARVFYNVGNCNFKQGQLDAAINVYKTSLLLNPGDIQTKQNLEFCLKMKEQMQNQPKSDSTKQNQQQQQVQPQSGQMSKDQSERILQALDTKEKENRKKEQEKPAEEKVEKDW